MWLRLQLWQCLLMDSHLPDRSTPHAFTPQVVSCACDLGTFVCGLLVTVLPADNPRRT